MVDIIKKKRDGFELSKLEIQSVIDGIMNNQIPDYQISAFLMALYFKKMNEKETAYLTTALLNSGIKIDLSEIEGIKVDKHSTGGVGDKTTLIVAPMVAAAGVPVAKMSGRGLGHTGGTIDKLESITGFSTNLSKDEFIEKVKKYHIALCGQNEELVPAGKKLYALRAVTATVDNLALITSSIMSKKLACGADAIVIDMKFGKGAYMKDLAKARRLGQVMINIGEKMNRQVVVLITAMDQPLGFAVGNALEIKEAIATLQGQGPDDVMELCLELGANMLLLAKKTAGIEQGRVLLRELVKSGAAFNKFKTLIKSQGGELSEIEDTNLLPSSQHQQEYVSKKSGYIVELNALEIGKASVVLGAGRETKESKIDLGAGILLKKKIGDYVHKGENLAILYSEDVVNFKSAETHMNLAYRFANEAPILGSIIYETMR